MNIIKKVLFLFISFTLIFTPVVKADKEDKAEEVDEEEIKMQDSVNTSVEIGPPDSHEAMNNRDSNTGAKINAREKRSYQFLMGLVNNNSRYEQLPKDDTRSNSEQITSGASEMLLELMVRIAAHPQQWSEVHKLLRKIDTDLMTSKKILDEMTNSVDDSNHFNGNEKHKEEVKKDKVPHRQLEALSRTAKVTDSTTTTTEQNTISTTENRMVIILDGKSNSKIAKKENLTAQATRANAWPDFQKETSTYSSSPLSNAINKEVSSLQQKPLYPWQQNRSPNKAPFPRNFGFTYHRVTGKPSAHQRTHNAYIAVSVIAPKDQYADRKDKLLENELRQLKPWNHNQNLKNMATIRSNWVIQNDANDRGDRLEAGDSSKIEKRE